MCVFRFCGAHPTICHARARFKCRFDATADLEPLLVRNSIADVGQNWRKTSGKRSMLICAAGTYAATQDGAIDVDLLRVMWSYHRCAFLLDSMVTVYSIVPDGDSVVAL